MSRIKDLKDDLILARAVEPDEIPTIDFAPFLAGGQKDRIEVATRIAEACERIGFFSLVGHAIPPALRQAVFDQSAAFFAQPPEVRAGAAATPDRFRGWIPEPPPAPGAHRSRRFEQYRMQSEWPPLEGPEARHNRYYSQLNRWPDTLPAFQETCTRYYEAMVALGRDLMHAFAMGLGLPADRLDGFLRQPLCQLTLLHYLPLPPDAEAVLSNTVAHTDDGACTILAQDDVGGLEVRRRDGVWIAAPPMENAYTINVGDMLMWWSNGRYLSNLHRVKNRAARERFSVPFFMNPSRDVVVEPLPECMAPGVAAAFAPVHVGDHMARFYTDAPPPEVVEKTAGS